MGAHGTQKQECGNTGAGPLGAAARGWTDTHTSWYPASSRPPDSEQTRPEDRQRCLTWLPSTTPSNADNVRKIPESVSTYRFIFCGVGGG